VTRTAVLLGANLLIGAAALGWALWRFGAPALALLARDPSLAGLAAVGALIGAGLAVDAFRWRLLLVGLDRPPALRSLTAFRAAGQAVSALVPSARLGGEPLRMWLATTAGVRPANAIATVVVDRALEMGASSGFACVFAIVLVLHGVPQLGGALATVGLALVGFVAGVTLAVRRLRGGRGLASAAVRALGLDRLAFVGNRMETVAEAEDATAKILARPARLVRAFAVGLVATGLVIVEYAVLLRSFDLPVGAVAVVAAIFASGAAHALPVPAAVGALEGGTMWLFGVLGHPPEVGLAVGLAVRLRDLLWVTPGLAYLVGRGALGIGRRPEGR
jgi:uncharacterized protein (TIRG00374 family)